MDPRRWGLLAVGWRTGISGLHLRSARKGIPEKTGIYDALENLFWEQVDALTGLRKHGHNIDYMMNSRLRASSRHGGQLLLDLLCSDPPRGRPFGGGGTIAIVQN